MDPAGDAPRTGTPIAIPDLPRATTWTRLWQPFWAVPMAIVMAAFVLALVLPALDSALGRFDSSVNVVINGCSAVRVTSHRPLAVVDPTALALRLIAAGDAR